MCGVRGCEEAEEGHYNYLSKTLLDKQLCFFFSYDKTKSYFSSIALSEEVLMSKEVRQLY